MSATPLLMIPGPIEISDRVAAAAAGRPPSHVSPAFIQAFGDTLRAMRHVWRAGPDHQPFVVAGSGTLAMEAAVTNLMEPGDHALLVNTGYFSDRMAEMLARRGVEVTQVRAEPGEAPSAAAVSEALIASAKPFKALFATHVDTSTGVRIDAEGICGVARAHELLTVFDGVCATGGERFEMSAWGADVYLTASQKALGAPPGLAAWVASPRALAARDALTTPPPLSLDFHSWLPIFRAYEEGRPSYFATPPTSQVLALHAALDEILARGATPEAAMDAQFEQHALAARAMQAAWATLGLRQLPNPDLAANTLSALRYPDGVNASFLARVRDHGAIIAGGLHPALKDAYFRVGHMGITAFRPDDLLATVRAIAHGLRDAGHACDPDAAIAAANGHLTR